jgi:outer membrane protein assembly factor BamB
VGGDLGNMGAGWAVDASTIYSYSESHVIRALDTVDGAERWSAPGWADGLNDTDLVPVGGLLVVGTSVVVAALDATSGQRLWELPRRVDFSHVAVVDGIVLAGWRGSSGVVALDASSGSRLWGGEEPNAFDFAARVAAGGGRAYAIYNSELRALDLRTGRVRWTYDVDDGTGRSVNSRPIVGADVVFVVTPSALVAIDAAYGSVRWRTPLALFPLFPVGAGVELIGDVLAVLTEHDDGRGVLVRGLDAATGAERWTVPSTGPAALWRPYGADGRLYVSTDAGPTACYDAVTGDLRWSHENPSPGLVRPVAATGPDVYLLVGDALQAVTAP